MAIRLCPLCNTNNASIELEYEPRDFDQCILAKQSLVKVCRLCGMIYTDHGIDDVSIKSFYETYSLYSGSDAGFGTGGSTFADIGRYNWYTTLLKESGISNNALICDLGCGKGGFLEYLRQLGFLQLRAVEVDPRCVDFARRTYGIDARQGSTDAIPFSNESIEVIVAAQVMEHIGDVRRSFGECWRVLKPGGLLLIEVPDASRYAETRLHDFAWVALMEHVNHFTPKTMERMLQNSGFSLVTASKTDQIIKAPHRYPSLCCIGRKETDIMPKTIYPDSDVHEWLSAHINQEWHYARSRARWLNNLFASGNKIACWGISREFFNLIRFSGLDALKAYALYDKNPLKTALTVSGKPVVHPDLLPLDKEDVTLIITSVLHADAIASEAENRGFKGPVYMLEQDPSFILS